jgi:hypothetical protein
VDDAAMAPAAGTTRHLIFLTVGTRSGNSAGCGLRPLYIVVFSSRFRPPQSRQATATPNPGGTEIG